jgi:tripartite-type tricarboxylate transporter receptor subunit TctC
MTIPRRQFLRLAAGAAALPALPRVAVAQTFPSRPVRILVGFTAGGTLDIAARLIAQWLTQRLGQPFLVENRPGASTNIAAEAVARAPADGYTLFLGGAINAINATLFEKLNFNFIADFSPVAGIMRFPNLMAVSSAFPARTVAEFVAYAKANPGRVSMGSGGSGTSQHLSGELFKMMTGIDMLHVPYRGGPQALTDLIGGHVQVAFEGIPTSIEHVRAGTLRALAVTTAVRSEALPDVPSMAEILPGYEASGWTGLCAPRNAPVEVVEKLNREVNAGLVEAGIKAKLAGLGGIALGGPPGDFAKLIADDTAKWGRVIRTANIKPA